MGKKLFESVITVFFLLGVFCVMVALSSSSASSAVTITLNTPATNGYITGTYIFGATLGKGSNVTNCSWYYQASGGSSWTIFNSSINSSKYHISLGTNNSATVFNVSFATSTIGDGEDYTINVSCYNNSAGNVGVSSATVTGVDIDNDAPSLGAITIEHPNKVYYVTNTVKIKCTGSDVGTESTQIIVTKPSGKTVTKTATSDYVEFKDKDTNEAGKYLVDCKISAAYGANQTTSAAQKSFNMYYEDTGSGVTEEEAPVAKLDISTKDQNQGMIVGKQGETKTFTIDGTTAHELTFKEVGLTSAILVIKSDPVEVKINVGQYKLVDVDGDRTDDIKVTLKEISADGLAKVDIINLAKLEEKRAEERGETGPAETVAEEGGNMGLWITILVILIVIGVGYYLLKGKKGKKGEVKFSKQDLGL